MPLDPPTFLALAAACAPAAAPSTLLALARVESGLDPLAIGINGTLPHRLRVGSSGEAVAQATALIAGGANVDLGLAQINSANLGRLGLSVADAFDPCRSLEAGATLLASNYQRLVRAVAANDQSALRTALSLYNTGDRSRGFRNGYVARVERSAGAAAGPASDFHHVHHRLERPAWDAFGDLRPAAFVTLPTSNQGDRP